MNIEQIQKELGIARNSIDDSGELPYTKRLSLLNALGDKKGEFWEWYLNKAIPNALIY